MNETGIRWQSQSKYVDIDTGQILRRKDAINKNKYIIIKTNKEVRINEHKTKGYIVYTRECRRQPQTKLHLD